eukprot:3674258-Karenia_brevis.AAC.1
MASGCSRWGACLAMPEFGVQARPAPPATSFTFDHYCTESLLQVENKVLLSENTAFCMIDFPKPIMRRVSAHESFDPSDLWPSPLHFEVCKELSQLGP